jgi:hypothetical protein
VERDGALQNPEQRLQRLESLVQDLLSASAIDNARRGTLVAGAATSALTANFATTAGSATSASTATVALEANSLTEVTTQAAIANDTAGATYGVDEQAMLQEAHNLIKKATDTLRALGAWG